MFLYIGQKIATTTKLERDRGRDRDRDRNIEAEAEIEVNTLSHFNSVSYKLLQSYCEEFTKYILHQPATDCLKTYSTSLRF